MLVLPTTLHTVAHAASLINTSMTGGTNEQTKLCKSTVDCRKGCTFVLLIVRGCLSLACHTCQHPSLCAAGLHVARNHVCLLHCSVPAASSACLQADTCDVVSGAFMPQQQLPQEQTSVESREKKFCYREIKFSKINIPSWQKPVSATQVIFTGKSLV